MASKDFSDVQVQVLCGALDMYVASYTRRVNAESDLDAKSVWQKKIDDANVLLSKIRLK